MAVKKITVEVGDDLKIRVDYEGFEGNACFQEADAFRHALAMYGVDAEVIKVDNKRNEVETRKLQTGVTAGR
jgi:hypothetical protein